ncbi:hypothetical protein HanIR_Chr14g0718081 [Helianthus annuus]|nr:hypothetical protein HanIR_Chr14g0718081 [Helianthus annuus]
MRAYFRELRAFHVCHYTETLLKSIQVIFKVIVLSLLLIVFLLGLVLKLGFCTCLCI